jgi:signal transduction histidine kinase
MKIKLKLTLIFSIVFGMVLLLFIVGVYRFYSVKYHDDFFERLHLRGAVKVNLIDGETIEPEILHLIYENSLQKYEPQVSIFNKNGEVIYRDRQTSLPEAEQRRMIKEIQTDGIYKAWYGKNQTFGFLIEGLKGDYIVIATGYDALGYAQLRVLRLVFGVAYLIVMVCIIFILRLFIKQAFNPVSQMIDKVQAINDSNHLDIRIDEGNKKDELAELAITFNRMLEQLKTSFEAQKQFVYNISHELRTPLSAIITELELSRQKDLSKVEYRQVIERTLQDAKRLAKLSTDLLDIAKANYNSAQIAMHKVRLDELLIEVCNKVQKSNSEYTVQLHFDKNFDDERLISLLGNEYLLGVAFSNLIENGCKFSTDKTCEVHISYENEFVIIRIIDHGIGITPEDQQLIFTPFYRGNNRNFASGNGIGLALSRKIIEIHNGNIALESSPGFTAFAVQLKNLL